MTYTDQLEQKWIRSLICEAERDLVFLWNITTSSFGGPKYEEDELPLAIGRVSGSLIKSGCSVGFGNPDDKTWQPEVDLINAEDPGAEITARWLADPKQVEFLVFARRHGC